MSTIRAKYGLVLAFLLFSPGVVLANGFRIPDQGARGMGMANAATAQGTDASALYSNPAAVGVLDGTYTSSGITFIYATGSDFRSDNVDPAGPVGPAPDQSADDDLFYPLNMYFVTDGGTEKFNFGLAIFSGYGLGRDWDDDAGFERPLDEVDLITVSIQPSVTYEIMDDLYASLFMTIMASKINFMGKPQANFGPLGIRDVMDLDLSADGTGTGYGLAAYWEPCDSIQIGAIYRSEVTIDYEGHAEANDIQPLLQALAGGRSSVETDAETEIHFPATVSLGIAYKPSDKWLIEVDVDFTGWQSFRNVSVRLDEQVPGIGFSNEAISLRSSWHNAFTYRLGGQYAYDENWKFRMGYVYDQNPIPDHTLHPSLPDSDRHGLATGVGYTCGDWTFDFSYMALFFEDRDISNGVTDVHNIRQDGTYENMAHLWALSVGKKW